MAEISIIEFKLQAAMQSGDPKTIAACVKTATQAVNNAGPNVDVSGLNALIAQAQGMASEPASTAVLDLVFSNIPVPPATVFEQHIEKYFSTSERNFYNSIDPAAQYDGIQQRNPDGTLKTEGTQAPEKITGAQLRDAFATTKYFALPEEEREKVNKAQPGGKAENDVKKMSDLHSSLNTLESFELKQQGKGAEAHLTETFTKAHKKVDEVINAISAKEKGSITLDADTILTDDQKAKWQAHEKGLSDDVSRTKNELSDILQHEVIEKAMGLSPDQPNYKAMHLDQEYNFHPLSGQNSQPTAKTLVQY